METTECNFCGHMSTNYRIHGLRICSACKCGYPEDEPDDQDLFDDELEFKMPMPQLDAFVFLLNSR